MILPPVILAFQVLTGAICRISSKGCLFQVSKQSVVSPQARISESPNPAEALDRSFRWWGVEKQKSSVRERERIGDRVKRVKNTASS
jgi:hypothetical protein